MKNRILSLCLAFLFLFTLLSCSGKEAVTASGTVTRDPKFSSANVSLSPEEFAACGFALGDSCDIEFGNGYKLTDVPFYNGYYVKNGAPVLVAYPGFTYIGITLNNMGIWDQAGLEEDMPVTITLRSHGRYSAVQDSLGQAYSFERTDYESDEQFVNFRALTGGDLKPDTLFRGASPVDNSRGRAPYTDSLLKENGIGFILDLADSEDDIARYTGTEGFASDYAASLIASGNAALLAMGSSYQSDEYKQKLVSGLNRMLASEDCPVYIHCLEGKDRTGFVCMLLEALAGASYDEMLADYMITYRNYYSVSQDETPEKYDAIADLYFSAFAGYLHGTDDMDTLKSAGYAEDAAAYLRSGGMDDAAITALRDRITK